MLSRLKRVARPARPVLLPIWRLVQPAKPRLGRDPWQTQAGSEGAGTAYRSPNAASPIRALRSSEFDAVAARFRYYKGRRDYTAAGCRIADDLIARHELRTALELGPYVRPIVVGADVMDLRVREELESEGRVIIHDATDTPWPFEDRQYGLFVAMQVFEHLGDHQKKAFLEVRRVARNAIISLPIDWVMKDTTNAHHMLTNERALSWFLPVVPTRVELGSGGKRKRKRLIYVFEDLPPLAAPGDIQATPVNA